MIDVSAAQVSAAGSARAVPHGAAETSFTGFSPAPPVKSGPNANRGQKSRSRGFALGIDYLTMIFPLSRLDECGQGIYLLLSFIFGGRAELKWGGWTGRGYNFYRDSSIIWDREGQVAGRVAVGGNNDTMLVELSGTGCRWVKDWQHVRRQAELLHARISRCDVALDDFDGRLLNVHKLDGDARAGLFAGAGRPPKSRFLDDHGKGTGCTLYVGRKGHKELCTYEKGKQLGDETSPWVRAEVRLYGKHYGEVDPSGVVSRSLPLDILTEPARYFRGAYDYLATLTAGLMLKAGQRLKVVKAKLDVSAVAAVNWLRTQCGPTLHLLRKALGDEAEAFLCKHVLRESPPARFKSLGAGNQLHELLRNELCRMLS